MMWAFMLLFGMNVYCGYLLTREFLIIFAADEDEEDEVQEIEMTKIE
jgi:hypothetical protein